MGCDIHMVLEQKHNDGWVGIHSYPHLDTTTLYSMYPSSSSFERERRSGEWARSWPRITGRDYELFAKLASIRGEGLAPLGVPEDVSELARMHIDRWDCDGHSHSYLSLAKFTKLYATTESAIADSTKDRLQGKDLHSKEVYCTGGYDFTDYDEDFDAEHDARIVFWFDN
jgi:hypothetical protein